jgi:hypothetical protein
MTRSRAHERLSRQNDRLFFCGKLSLFDRQSPCTPQQEDKGDAPPKPRFIKRQLVRNEQRRSFIGIATVTNSQNCPGEIVFHATGYSMWTPFVAKYRIG